MIELVQVETTDGIRLEGALEVPAARAARGRIDAAVLVHGTGSNFYGSSLLARLSASLVAKGIAALRVNTRGHDLVCTLSGSEGPRRGGAAYERVDDCRHDLAAWLRLVSHRGFLRAGLVGHSLGGVKSIYAAAQFLAEGEGSLLPLELQPAAVVAISPPRLSRTAFLSSMRGGEFQNDMARAQALFDRGQGDSLLDIRFPLPYPVTAAGYLDKYGSDERYDVLKWIGQVGCPLACTWGDQELRGNAAFTGLSETVGGMATGAGPVRVDVLAGADHFYSGCQTELAARVLGWLCPSE